VDAAAYRAEHEAWREYRRGRLLAPPDGPLLWIGLWELHAGSNAFGSDSALPIVLPAGLAPAVAGDVRLTGLRARLEPAPHSGLRFANGTPVEGPIELRSDALSDPTTVRLGRLGLRLHESPAGRFWLRVWDEEHDNLRTFEGAPFFPIDLTWRLAARYEPFREPRTFRVADVTGAIQEYAASGALVFRRGDRTFRLTAFAEPEDTRFWIIFEDSTNAGETYPAGRYLLAPLPDSTGWTTLDFNRAYSPPCAFSPFSTCALPPWENRLALAVRAGELHPR